jgi:hypothetical protein
MVDNNVVSNEAFVNSGRLQLVVLRLAMLSCVQLAAAPIGLFAQTVTIHIRLLDGRTGHYLSGMNLAFVDYHTDDNGGHHDDLNGRMTVKTSAEGDSYVANPDAHGVLVFNGMGINGSGRRALGKGSTIAIRGHTEMSIFTRFLRSSPRA